MGVVNKVHDLEGNAISGQLEARDAGRVELEEVYQIAGEIVGQLSHIVDFTPGGTAFVTPWFLQAKLSPAASSLGMHIELIGEVTESDRRTLGHVPEALVPRVELGLWKQKPKAGEDPVDRGILGRQYAVAALSEARGEPWPGWRKKSSGRVFDATAVEIVSKEAERLGLPGDLMSVDPALARFLTVVGDARSLVEATAPQIVDYLPPAPGLQPTGQQRFHMIHQLARLYVAALERTVGKEPPEDLADGLANVLRPYGLTVLVDLASNRPD
ncbi:MAG: hypothetical protein ACT4NP_13220 [Pseudonocardiales bacterium]